VVPEGGVRVSSRIFGRIRRRSGGISAVISIARSSHTLILQARKLPKTNAYAKPDTDGTQPFWTVTSTVRPLRTLSTQKMLRSVSVIRAMIGIMTRRPVS
jgi:hypothetical protein